jgi:hypothetical protein
VSSITLSLLKDTGWYTNVNLTYSEGNNMTFGRNRGCLFLTTNACSTTPEYCTSGSNITFYHNSFGLCQNTGFLSSCKANLDYSRRNCKDPNFLGIYGNRSVTFDTPGWNAQGYLATVINR